MPTIQQLIRKKRQSLKKKTKQIINKTLLYEMWTLTQLPNMLQVNIRLLLKAG